MPHLLRNKKIALSFFAYLLCACTTSQYKVHYDDKLSSGLVVTPDRMLLECEDIQADQEHAGSYGFMVHILDDEKTVLTAVQLVTISKEECTRELQGVEKLMKKSSKIYISGRSRLSEPRQKGFRKYLFPKHGTFIENKRYFDLVLVKGEDGSCFTSFYGEGKPCPEIPGFPASKAPF